MCILCATYCGLLGPGGALLAYLVSEVIKVLSKLPIIIPNEYIVLWTNSTIVLTSIDSLQLLKPFVANLAARILDVTQYS